MDDDELEHFEVITLDSDTRSFVDDDGIFEIYNGNWCEVNYTRAAYTRQVVH